MVVWNHQRATDDSNEKILDTWPIDQRFLNPKTRNGKVNRGSRDVKIAYPLIEESTTVSWDGCDTPKYLTYYFLVLEDCKTIPPFYMMHLRTCKTDSFNVSVNARARCALDDVWYGSLNQQGSVGQWYGYGFVMKG